MKWDKKQKNIECFTLGKIVLPKGPVMEHHIP